MSTSPELMYAILAMDAYNRGYDPGIEGLGGMGSQVGTATVGIDADDLGDEAKAAGFYAMAYEWNGKTIISYRGTESGERIRYCPKANQTMRRVEREE